MTQHAYIIGLLPLLGFLMIVFFLRWKEKVAAGFSISMILLSWMMSVWVLIETIASETGSYEAILYKFVALGSFELEIGLLVDPLTAIMLVVVTTVGSCVQIYSTGYMKGDPRYSRFFAYLSLFLFSMLGLVLSNNFFMIFIFWELVGLTSYLLIGFWFEKKSAADACKKAFLTTRIGDLGFLLSLLLMAVFAGTLNYAGVFEQVAAGAFPPAVLTIAAIALFAGAVGKSAQFPLHVWLPDAMEGPTPVSALIHAATMVAAGVYLVARSMDVFIATADGAMTVAIIGLITSFLAATIAITQNDIKRILAYSTISQLGYMIMALGLYGYDTALGHHSPGYYAGTFHLMTHAFFKGLLFLGAGSVIHAVHTNNIQEMGGLLKKMKITAPTFLIASLSIAGIFPFAGFWSKDEIVASTVGHPIFMFFTLLIAFMTAFYMWRLCFLTFFGEPRDQHRYDNAHESPRAMSWPLAFLGFLAVTAGWVGIPWLTNGFASFAYHGEPYYPHANWLLMGVSTIVAASGIYLAYLMYYKRSISADKLAERFKPLYNLSLNKWYFDEIYQVILINPIMAIGRFLWKFDANVIDGAVNGIAWLIMIWADFKMWIDKWIIDGAVNGSGWIVKKFGNGLRHIQTGSMQFYVLFTITLVVLFGLWKFEFTFISDNWPSMTIIFVIGVVVLAILTKMVTNKEDSEQDSKQEN